MATAKSIDREFYDALNEFVEYKVISMPASYDEVIAALEEKAADLRRKLKEN